MENEEDTWTHIHFDLGVVNFDAIRAIQRDLLKEGITFDSGGTRETFEWHTDWSLTSRCRCRECVSGDLMSSADYTKLVKDLTDLLDEKGIAHTTVEVPKHD